ncbi:putative Ig domain-containing protein, partial [Synechococcus lacustris C3-12m-Tous]|uniref:lectin-like protein n=1 Tax=Synechococcus lacustris TaxID=2116544 RepID=UPI0020CEB06E
MAPVIRGNSLYTIVDGPTWTEAEANAVKLGGHLVAINDVQETLFLQESDFLRSIHESYEWQNGWDVHGGAWIGLTRRGGNNWQWSSQQNYLYNNWNPGEPSGDGGGNEDAHIYTYGDNQGKWNDIPAGWSPLPGITETPFIRRGDSAYVIVSGPTWEEAEANAVKLGGHLVTINDASENEWTKNTFSNVKSASSGGADFWIGYTDRDVEGQWKWVDGTSSTFKNFTPDNGISNGTGVYPTYDNRYTSSNWWLGNTLPFDRSIGEDYGLINAPSGAWNDLPINHRDGSIGIAEIKLAPNNTPTGSPTVTGTFKVGSTLTIDATAIKDSDNFTGYTPTFNYNWETSTDGTTWSKLTSTDAVDNNNTYILTAAETNKKVRGVVSYLDGYGTNEVVNSAASTVEQNSSSSKTQWLAHSGQATDDGSAGIAQFSNGDIATAYSVSKSNGASSVLVQRLNNSGEVVWTLDIGADFAPGAGSVLVGKDDKVYVVGGTKLDADGESGKNDSDVFASVISSTGSKLWYKNYGVGIHEIGSTAVLDANGNIVLNGRVSEVNDAYTMIKDVPNFYGAEFSGGWRGFQLKINPLDGSVSKAYTTGSGNSGGELIAVDQLRNIVFVGGYTFGAVNGINTVGNGDPAGANKYLIARNETSGAALWTRMENWIRSNLVTQESEDAVYFVDKGILEKVKGSTGVTQWTKPLSNTDYRLSPIKGGGILLSETKSTGALTIRRFDSTGNESGSQVINHTGDLYPHSFIENGDGILIVSGSTTGAITTPSSATIKTAKQAGSDAFVYQVNSSFSTTISTPTYTLTPSTTSINEGAVLTSTVATTNVATGTKFYYALSGTGITTADFSAGALTGEGSTDATGKFSFTHTLANDLTTEGAESLEIKLYSDTARTLQVGSTATVSVVDSSTTAPLVVRGNSLYTIVDGPSWTQAEANSVKLGGHLVSISSDSENKFLVDQYAFDSAGYNGDISYYLGLTDKASKGTWIWSDGSPLSFSNWSPGEPQQTSGEDYSEFLLVSTGPRNPGQWGDNFETIGSGKGISETPFIRRGDSAYVIVSGPTWEEAEANAVKLGGHLVTINDAAENEWLYGQITNRRGSEWGLWIGATDKISEGIWTDSEGNKIGFNNFYPPEPNNLSHYDSKGEDYAAITTELGANGGKWADIANAHPTPNSIISGIAEIKLAPNNTPTGTPTVTGTFKVGSTLTIDATTIKDSDNFTGYTPTFKYNWETSTDGTTWSKLTTTDGADNNNTYILTAAETSKKIRGVVSYLDGYGTNEVVNSVTSESTITPAGLPTQSLTLSAPSKTAIRSGISTTSAITYNVSTGNTALTGVGASLYFDSTQLSVSIAGDPFKTGLLGNAITADTSNADGDPKTDKVLSLSYLDFGGNFPGSGTTLPLTLANLNLVPTTTFSGSTLHLKGDPAIGFTATGADLSIAHNAAPVVNGSIPALSTNRYTPFSYTLKSDLFSDPDSSITLSATTNTGDTLPSWLTFNPTTRTLSGTPTIGGTINLNLSATDELGSISTPLSLKIKEVQSLSSSTTPIRYQRNKELTVPINYSTSDGSSTTGLSFKVHFNSSLLSFDSTTGITNKTQADLFQIGAIQQDTANSDNDATTDSFIPINIASFTGQFPTAGVPVKLADLIFKSLDKPIDPITGLKDTSINF